MPTIAGFLAQCDYMANGPFYYDNRVPQRCYVHGYGRDCSTFCAFALINAGYSGVNPCENSYGFARACYYAERPDWFIQQFGPGQGTFISHDQAKTVVCFGFKGNNHGMSPDNSGNGHIEVILGRGQLSVGAHSHATGIGYDDDGLDTHNLTSFAVPPWFLGEMGFTILDPATLAALAKLRKWVDDVTETPLNFGDRGENVAVMVDLLRQHHFLRKNVHGNAYGKVARTGVVKFKNMIPQLAAQPAPAKGENFGGTAAESLLHYG